MDWTDEQVAELTRLWNDEGASSPAIARQMGVTKNMVIGKARRLGLKMRTRGRKPPRGGGRPVPIQIVFDGVTYPSQRALARHLAPQVGRTAGAVDALLRQYGSDGAAVIAYYRRGWSITYDGVTYRSRRALALHLAPRLWLTVGRVENLLRQYRDDVDAILRSREQQPTHKPITYDGVTYPTHRALERVLALRLGVSPTRVQQLLKQHHDDIDAVLASRCFRFGNEVFASKSAFCRHHGISEETFNRWARRFSPTELAAKVIAGPRASIRRRQRPRAPQAMVDH